jgi:hypothetical protein
MTLGVHARESSTELEQSRCCAHHSEDRHAEADSPIARRAAGAFSRGST